MLSKEKIVLFILAGVNFTHIMDFMIMMPLGPQLISLFQITPQEFGFAVSAYSVTAGVSGFLSAFFVDRFDRQKTLLFAYIGFIIGTFACAFAPTYILLVAARVLAGLFGGLIGAQVLSIVGDLVPYERRASAMGIVMTSFSLASVAGVPAGLWLAAHYSWHMPFLFIGGVGVIVSIFIASFIPPVDAHLRSGEPKRSPLNVLSDIAHSPNQLRALALSIVLMVGHFCTIPFISPSLVSNANFRQDQIFLIYLVGGALTIFSSPLVGKLADRKGKFPIFALFAVLSTIPVLLITHLRPVPLWVILAIAGMFFVFANGRMIPTQAIVSSAAPTQQRGGFMSINSSVQQLASGFAATMAGMIIYQSESGRIERYDWVGYISVALIIGSIFLAKKVKPVG